MREKNDRAAAKRRRFPTAFYAEASVLREGSRMTDRREYVLRSTAKSKSKKRKKSPRPYNKQRCRPLILRRNIKPIIPVNNYTHSNFPRVNQISFPALPHGPGVHFGLQVTFTALSPCHSRNGAARYCGRAAGLTPSYLVTPILHRVALKSSRWMVKEERTEAREKYADL
jgi:hypothetical protein